MNVENRFSSSPHRPSFFSFLHDLKMFVAITGFFMLFFLVVFAGLTILVNTRGKDVLAWKLGRILNRKVAMDNLRIRLPLNIEVNNLTIDGKSPAKQIKLQMEFANMMSEGIRIARITLVEPTVNVRRTKEGALEFLDFVQKADPQPVPSSPVDKTPLPPESSKSSSSEATSSAARYFLVDQLIVHKGTIHFVDSSSEQEQAVDLAGVELSMYDVTFPLTVLNSHFQVSAVLQKDKFPLSGSVIHAEGWVDVAHKNLDVDVKVTEADGHEGLTAKLKSRNNDMNVRGQVKLKEIGKKIKKADDPKTSSLEDMLLSAVEQSGLQISARFDFNTKMDNFQPWAGPVSLLGQIGFSQPREGTGAKNVVDFEGIGKQFEMYGDKFKKDAALSAKDSQDPTAAVTSTAIPSEENLAE